MANTVFANGLEVSCKVSSGKSIAAFPDPCWSPPSPPAGPIVIPYANTAYAKDLSNGSTSVLVGGKPIAQKDKSFFSKSTGNEAATRNFGQGMVTATIKGKAYFVSWSMNVMVEGYNVARHTDLMTHNHGSKLGNTMLNVHTSTGDGGGVTQKDEMEKCKHCGKKKHKFVDKEGNHVGKGQKLRKNIIRKISEHPWYTGARSLQAHHLICSETMKTEDWIDLCRDFGYDINHKNNGVMLPSSLALACQLHVPLHLGPHGLGTVGGGEAYPKKIAKILEEVRKRTKNGAYCKNPEGFVKTLDSISKQILIKLGRFEWTITYDGKDYALEGNGCAGVGCAESGRAGSSRAGSGSLSDKRALGRHPCPDCRQHDLTGPDKKPLPRFYNKLEIGR